MSKTKTNIFIGFLFGLFNMKSINVFIYFLNLNLKNNT